MAINKGFIKDLWGNTILPITRGELVLDSDGNVALNSLNFLANANGNGLPGLVTAAERALLQGGGQNGGITDIYNKLGFINKGLYFNDTELNFYTADGASTPIKISTVGDGALSMIISPGNLVNLSLPTINTQVLDINAVIKSINVDKYGRVTSVSGSALDNSDIPAELIGKTIKNGTLDSCKTAVTEIPDEDNAIVNKAYVDAQFREISGKTSGALKFKGVISDSDTALTLLADSKNKDTYFKITGEFKINSSYLYDTNGLKIDSDGNLNTNIGDTVIIYQDSGSYGNPKFIYIPSGDDITAITVKCDSADSPILNGVVGSVTLQFANPFTATKQGNTAYIQLPNVAQSAVGGYLSREDYNKFNNIVGTLQVSYDSLISPGLGVYQLGTLTIGSTEKAIYGKNNITSLTLTDGSDSNSTYNPILKFTETGATDVNITLKGINGIRVLKNGDNVEFVAVNEVIEQDVPQENNQRKTKYLTIDDGYKFGVKLGSVNADGTITDGLTDFSQFSALVNKVSVTTSFELIDYSLKGEASETEYRYGNQKLRDAVYVTI